MFDLDIPGFCSRAQLEFLAELASRVPESGRIVEVGSLAGRSAYTLAASCRKSVTLYCVDPWKSDEITARFESTAPDGFSTVNFINTIQLFQTHMNQRNIKNIVTIQSESPLVEGWKQGPVNLVYVDGNHRYPAVSADIEFWLKHIEKDGAICGDDFCEKQFPGVVQAVRERAADHGLEVRSYGKLWILVSKLNGPWLWEAYQAFLENREKLHESRAQS